MYWQVRSNQPNHNQTIINDMHEIRKEHKDYGCLRMTRELRSRGYLVNKKKVARLMNENNLNVQTYTRKSREYSSYKGDTGKSRKNLIHRRYNIPVVHQKITTDTTEFKYYMIDEFGVLRVQKLYLDPFMDMFNGEIIFFRLSKRPNSEAVMAALEEAIKITEDCLYRRTFHSDRGWAYQMKAYQNKLKEHKIFQIFSRKGNCLDNSPMENFFGLLKQEMYHGNTFYSSDELEKAIIDYIHYYNHRRMKQKLNWMSPVAYRITENKIA